jgi:GNAT superfamily N-acetyltransferase
VIQIRRVEPERLHDLRRRVLRDNDPTKKVADDRDQEDSAWHFAALDGDEVVGCGSFYPSPTPFPSEGLTYQLRYLATDESRQGQHIGSALLAAAEDQLSSIKVDRLWANGRDSALGFYDRQGWERIAGSEHLSAETGLPHTVITKSLRETGPVTLDICRPGDVQELMDLRRRMFFSNRLVDVNGPWIANFEPHYLEGVAAGRTVGTVGRNEQGQIVTAALADLVIGLPMRSTPRGRTAYIHSVVTRAPYRRRGLSRQVFAAVMQQIEAWDVDAIDLHATRFGESLYRDFGFTDRQTGVALRWTPPRN